MIKIKMVSNPYNRSITYLIYKEQAGTWEDIKQESINSRLRENDEDKIFLPFKVKEIIDTIITEYYVGADKVQLIFEGTADEYEEVENVCNDEKVREKIQLTRSDLVLESARDILGHTKEIFATVHPLINNIVKDDAVITKGLNKVSDALKDVIPICIFGNYSAGKSTFINALIGNEILPSGGDPVTAKIFEIKRSQYPDRAQVKFAYREEKFELRFDNKGCSVVVGDKEKDIIQEIMEAATKEADRSLFAMVNATINILNFYERRDKTKMLIGDVVEIEIPFSANGVLGQTQNKFVIFDTPGSNSNTNIDHEQVLTESLEEFSNGIPVWVSQYDAIDSVDNAHLCDKLYKIDALDKRFTMIVVNKSDSVELPKNGLARDDIRNIMEYESVEKMYSSGIYFVSSVMGLGAKNKDGFLSEYLMDVFDEKERKFSDPEARSYKKLYEYNIMPEQMKKRAIEYSRACDNRIYSNSGIFCVEMAMEQFASKYAAYNKCQMVYLFLGSVINETGRRIAEKTKMLEKRKQQWETELDSRKLELLEKIRQNTQDSVKKYDKESKTYILGFVKEFLTYEHTTDELNSIDQTLSKQNSQEANFESVEKELEGAKNSRWKNLLENSQNLFKGNFVDSVKSLAVEWSSDSKKMQQKRTELDLTKRDIDQATSDSLLHIVVGEFRNNMVDAQNKLIEASRKYWQEKAQQYRDVMIGIITGADALSVQQRKELLDVILSYQQLVFDDNAEKVFIKAKFLRGNVLGIRLGLSERIDTRRLASSYNYRIKKNIAEMSEMINKNCYDSFKTWQENFQGTIEENITIYNSELRELTEFIKEESERIHELQSNQQTITTSFKTIENMMSWKKLE